MCKSSLHQFLHALPKCEHHIHLEGALTPSLVFTLASKNHISLPDLPIYHSPETLAARYEKFDNLDDFLNIHYANMGVLITEDDFHQLAWSYFLAAHADGVYHAEVFFDPQSHTSRGIDIASVIKGYGSACDRAESELGMTTCLIMCFLRHLPVPSAEETLQSAQKFIHDGTIIGVGLDSSEVGFPPELFTEVFRSAEKAGLRRTAHGGEEGDTSYIKGALTALNVERIDHGIRLTEDPKLMKEIAAKGTLLTICPLSNVYLRTTKSIGSLPLREFLDAGVQFSLNSDDPAYFGGGVLNNYCAVQEAFDFGIDEWKTIAVAGIKGSWIDEQRKQDLVQRVNERVAQFS
ncbi:hypothetical protein V491_05112 [Pseudogymnoascus sp. VKM F-3775]|nr:hypothetical protein V491_05112 [Pseudogymnoascus sp. VKM F-3775]